MNKLNRERDLKRSQAGAKGTRKSWQRLRRPRPAPLVPATEPAEAPDIAAVDAARRLSIVSLSGLAQRGLALRNSHDRQRQTVAPVVSSVSVRWAEDPHTRASCVSLGSTPRAPTDELSSALSNAYLDSRPASVQESGARREQSS